MSRLNDIDSNISRGFFVNSLTIASAVAYPA